MKTIDSLSTFSITPLRDRDSVLIFVGGEQYICALEQFEAAANDVLCPPELGQEWFTTYTGIKFYPWAPTREMVCLEDIAHHLANICRFSGAVREFYSVAQHCVLTSKIVPPQFALLGLMHDATEAYLNDMIRPVKIGLVQYQWLEMRVWLAIAEKFNLSEHLPHFVKEADNIMLATERRDLIDNHEGHLWKIDEKGFKPMPQKIEPWSPAVAEVEFINRFNELSK